MASAKPPILILVTDQQRGDCMGAAGNPAIRTPHMDRLAHEGMRFANGTTVSPLCMPARMSFLSGLYPHATGQWTNNGRMPAQDETLFQHLQRAGYHTAHVGKGHYFPPVRGMHFKDYEPYMHRRGFDFVHETTGPNTTARIRSYLNDHWREVGDWDSAYREDYAKRREVGPFAVWPSPLPADEHPDGYVGRRAVEYIRAYDGDKPLCLFVGFPGPHEPWDAPLPYAEMYDPAGVPTLAGPAPAWYAPVRSAVALRKTGRVAIEQNGRAWRVCM